MLGCGLGDCSEKGVLGHGGVNKGVGIRLGCGMVHCSGGEVVC